LYFTHTQYHIAKIRRVYVRDTCGTLAEIRNERVLRFRLKT